MFNQQAKTAERSKATKDKAASIMGSIFGRLEKENTKKTFLTLVQKSTQKKLLNNYRGQLAFGSIRRVLNRKMKQGFASLTSEGKKFELKKKGLLKLKSLSHHKNN